MALALRANAILCPGTRIRVANGEQYLVQSLGSLGHAIDLGGRKEPSPIDVLAARSYRDKRLANREFVREIRAAPDRFGGQGGAIRLRTGGGVVCFNEPLNEWELEDANSRLPKARR